MSTTITLKLFATLGKYAPENADYYPVSPGTTIGALLNELGVPLEKARLIFIDNVRKSLDSTLNGGERVGVFPPVGGG